MNEAAKLAKLESVALGLRIRQARRKSGMTQAQLGEALGTSGQAIQKYEKGENNIPSNKLFELAHVLRVPAAELVGGAEANAVFVAALDACGPSPSELIELFNQLRPSERQAVLDLMKTMVEVHQSPELD